MEAQILLKLDKRIFAASMDTNLGEGAVTINFPQDFDWEHLHDYRVENGDLVYDPLPIPEPEPTLEDVMKELLGVNGDE